MATDSAVTIGGLKAFNGVQKLFNILDDVPIGIMTNGPANFFGISIKKLIEYFKCEKFNEAYTVENIKDNFIKFLEGFNSNIDVEEYVEYNLNEFKKLLKAEFEDMLKSDFQFFIQSIDKRDVYPFLKEFNISFNDILPDFVENIYEINEILLKTFSYYLFDQSSEIIIAGYDEITKSSSYICFRLIIKTAKEVVYDIVDFETNIQEPFILSFGDDSEVKLFLNGITPELNDYIINLFKNSIHNYLNNFIRFCEDKKLDEEVISQIRDVCDEFRNYHEYIEQDFIDQIDYQKFERANPLNKLINSIPESVLVEFVVFLINSTSNRRKFSLDVENVGGEVEMILLKPDSIEFIHSNG